MLLFRHRVRRWGRSQIQTVQPSLIGSMLINTTPGSVALDVSPDRKLLYVHVMYMSTPDAARDEIKTGFERRVLGVLG
jgi:multisubunit Na+/H+ antiporter MnhE subunit